jgi:2-oxoglutarate dehydrogenase complex dehydrogenase (E1) component-like enzyme
MHIPDTAERRWLQERVEHDVGGKRFKGMVHAPIVNAGVLL